MGLGGQVWLLRVNIREGVKQVHNLSAFTFANPSANAGMDPNLYMKTLHARLYYSILIPTIGGQPGAYMYWSHGLAQKSKSRLGAFQGVGRSLKEPFSQHISQTPLGPSQCIECLLSFNTAYDPALPRLPPTASTQSAPRPPCPPFPVSPCSPCAGPRARGC